MHDSSEKEPNLADRFLSSSEKDQNLADRFLSSSNKDQSLADRFLSSSNKDQSLADRLFPNSAGEGDCFADRLFTELIPSCAILCYDAFHQPEGKEEEECTRPAYRGTDYVVWETPQLGPHKVILVGDSGVGKSSFMLRLCDDAFNEKMNPSFGLDFKTKVITVNGVEENIQIWDTAGQERFRSITQSYFRKVDGIILVYDITHEESFLNLQNWVTCIQESGQLSAPMTIIGNKLDLEHLRCVSREMATELANFYEADFVEVSAKDGRNINQLGYDLVSKLVERRALHSIQGGDSSFPVTRPPTKEFSESSCCVIL